MNNNNNTTNGTHSNDTASTNEILFIAQIVCFCVISVVGSFANVIICVGLSRGQLKSSEYFILNLAVADLLVCAIGIPLDIYLQYADSWPYGPFLCHVIYPSQTLLILISILTLMGMSLERHRAICSPLKQRLKPKWICLSIVFIWLIAIAAVVPYAKALKYADNDCGEYWSVPENAKYYTLALFTIDYCIPLTIITYCYARAGYVLNTKFKQFNRKECTSAKQNLATMKRLHQNKKVIKIFSTAVILFVICVLPGDCYWMWFSFRTNEYHPYDDHLPAFTTIMLYANSAINPFIFGAVQMICHRTLKSQLRDQLTSTTGFSRSKGSGSSIGTGDGWRKSFSRTAIRKHTSYTILKAKNGESGTKDSNNTIPGEHSTEIRYRDTENSLRDTNKNCRDTNQELCETNREQQDTSKLCDSDQTSHETSSAHRDTAEPQRDTDEKKRDTRNAPPCKSNETLNEVRSISSDSSATLNQDSDTYSSNSTSETVQNTNCELTKQPDNTDYEHYNTQGSVGKHALQETQNETKDFEPNTLQNVILPELSDMNKSVVNDSQNTKSDSEHRFESRERDKDSSTDFCGSTEFEFDKNRNILELIRETNL